MLRRKKAALFKKSAQKLLIPFDRAAETTGSPD